MRAAHRETVELFGRIGFVTHSSRDWKRKKTIGGVKGTGMRSVLLRAILSELNKRDDLDEDQECALEDIKNFQFLPDAFKVDIDTKSVVAIEVEDSHRTPRHKIDAYLMIAVDLDEFGWAFDVIAIDARCQIGWSLIWKDTETLSRCGLRRPDLEKFRLKSIG